MKLKLLVWVSIKDELPKKNKPVLILTDYGKMATAYLVDKKHPSYGWIDWMRPEHSYGGVTHWMKLPGLPREFNKLKY